MCVICHVPKTETLDDSRLARLWSRNPDGGGLAYISRRGNLVVEKSMNADQFKEQVKRVQSFRHRSDLLLHMRIATHGSVSLPNVHPFRVNEPQGRDDLVMAHNGIISKTTPKKVYSKKEKKSVPVDDRSDTRVFIEEVVNELPLNWLDNPAIVRMVSDFVGGSKLMFLSTRPELSKPVYIINKSAGTNRGDMWFSNSHGVDAPKSVVGTTPGAGYATYWDRYESDWTPSRSIQPDTYVTRMQKNYWENTRRRWEGWLGRATDDQVTQMVDEFNAIMKDRYFFSDQTRDAFEWTGRDWECLSCYSTIDLDMKTGWAECRCFDRECMVCTHECFQCECVLRPSEGSKVRRVRSMPTPKVTRMKPVGEEVTARSDTT